MGLLGHARSLWSRSKVELAVYRRVLADPRTPRWSRWLLTACIAYAVSPIDLIPDFIPVVGHLDDAVIVPLLAYLALRGIPPAVVAEHRAALADVVEASRG